MKIILISAALVFAASAARAQEPAALVEDVTGTSAGVEFMDYVPAGKIIKLGASDILVLSYLKSCTRETVKGGTLTVGAEKSAVAGGTLASETVKCDGGRMALAANQAAKGGAMVFRAPPKPAAAGAQPAPDLTLYGLSPVIDLKGGGTLLIERIDQPGERIEVQIGGQQLLRGAFYDFAKAGKALAAGGLYRATAGKQSLVLKVDPFAQGGQAPLVGRLVRFAAAS